MKPRLSRITVAIHSAIFLTASISTTVLAEQSNTEKTENKILENKSQEEIEVIQVTGIRSSLRENLNNKRFADTVVDSINTEDIAKNPDKNMAEALQRVAGVQIERQFGEGSKVSIRGTSPELTNTLVNGQSAKSVSYLPGQSESNAFDFSNIPADQVSKIEVYKSARADLDAGGIGGTVVLHTKKPLEQEDGYGYFNVEAEYNDSSEKSSPQVSTAYNFVNDEQTFGASISVSLQQRNALRSGFESGGVGSGTGFQKTDPIDCPTEECLSSDIKLRHMSGHNLIVTRHMALNGYTYGDLEAVAGNGFNADGLYEGYWPFAQAGVESNNSGVWNNNTQNWGQLDEVMNPTYIDPDWGLFWGSRRDGGLGQTAPLNIGNMLYSPAFSTEESRLDTTINLQWAPTDALNFNLELNQNSSDRDNKSDNLYAQTYRASQLLYSNGVPGVDPRLVMDPVQDIVLSATYPVDGVYLVGNAGEIWDGNGYRTNPATWGEMVRRDSNDRSGTETDQSRVHLTMDYTADQFEIKLQAGRTSAESTVLDRATTLASRYGDSETPYSGDDTALKIPTYEGVNLGYGYNPDTGKVYWGVEADPSLTGDELAAAQQRAQNFLLAPTNEFYLLTGGLRNTARYRENTEDFFQADITWELDNKFYIDSVKFGGKLRKLNHTEDYFTEDARFHGYSNEVSAFPVILAGEIAGGTVSGLDTAGHDIPDEYFAIDQNKRDALLNDHFLVLHSEGTPNKGSCEDAIAAYSGPNNYYGCRSGMTESAGDYYDVNEEYLAYYAMANFSGEKFRGNVGLRVVDTERESIGNEVAKDENGQPLSYPLDSSEAGYVEQLAGFNIYAPLVQTSSTKDYLPSFNISYDLADDLILRAAASKNISHPSLNQMRSTFYLATERYRLYNDGRQQDLTEEGLAERLAMDSQRRGSVGNPDLGSYTSINSEIGVEWYFDKSSIFSVTAFQKDIKDMVRATSKVQNLDYLGDEGRTDNNGYPVFGDYVVSSYFNTGEQKVKGLEMQLQHDFGNGFGGLVNYTYTDVPDQMFTNSTFAYEVGDMSDVETHVSDPSQRDYFEVTGFSTKTTVQSEPMFGQSQDTLNASVYFENETFSARLSYNYRSEFANQSDSEGIRYTDARSQLDFKATYQIMDNVVASFAVTNLTNENVVHYLDRSQIVNDPVINNMKWVDEIGDDGVPTGNRVIATDDNGNNIVESSVTGDAAFAILSEASGISVEELKPYYENHLDKVYVNEWTNGRRYYVGLNWTF
ncbi:MULTISPECIES: TonB-dependent receptor [unclassified Pseudoalteromonas]|uniref:TonB-dependent receptor domain-containing protein n=1 Tax=unclassified Pseudoalteromonas TaxID=194690 RepID=UPI0025B4A9F3|nr:MULTISPECIES: TonB-dependent receptor [unclassified Pseudoalteromonas]MDN3377603.1 TonB-dependent receptor [Pseudoalteromonas sp. APC 3893]MDN3385800.1 TonB-dependent receptor [Pseudoalteromonas sp. APC 4017]